MEPADREDALLQSVALQNATSILRARQRAEQDLLEAKEELRQSNDLLRATFEQAAVGIAIAGMDGRFTDMNVRFCEILGYTPAELRQRTFRDLTHPDDLTLTEESMRRLVAGEIRDYSVEKRYLRRDGQPVWCLAIVTLLHDPAGTAGRFIGVIEDISARKATEEALRQSEEHLRTLANSIPQLAWMAEPDGNIFWYNQRWYEYTGTTLADMEGWGWQSVHDPAVLPAVLERWRDTIASGQPFEMEFPLRGADGSFRWFLTQVNPVRDASGRIVRWFGTNTDIDQVKRVGQALAEASEERKQLLESERAARSAAEYASRMKDEFLATLSHELRTPLSAILGWSHMLRTRSVGPDELRKGLETIERNARMQTQLIEDLLDMSRITSGKVRLDVQPVQPGALVEAALETVRPAAEAKGIRLERLIDPAAGPVSGDPARLQQVVWNLLNNAIKFTPKEGKVQVVLARVNSHIEISVADTGVGIEPDFLEHVFDRFRQADSSTTRRYGGLGLGLAIVRHLVELHGGTVRAESPGPGKGSTFIVHLPLAVVHRASADEPRQHPTAASAVALDFQGVDLSGLRVLVVDDQPDARELVARVLTECKAEVITAASAGEALIMVERDRPHVLVSDIGMPDVDGFELIKRVRALGEKRGGRVPAIALTAFARSEDRTKALHYGFQVHVSKPVEPEELIATVASVAGRPGAGLPD